MITTILYVRVPDLFVVSGFRFDSSWLSTSVSLSGFGRPPMASASAASTHRAYTSNIYTNQLLCPRWPSPPSALHWPTPWLIARRRRQARRWSGGKEGDMLRPGGFAAAAARVTSGATMDATRTDIKPARTRYQVSWARLFRVSSLSCPVKLTSCLGSESIS